MLEVCGLEKCELHPSEKLIAQQDWPSLDKPAALQWSLLVFKQGADRGETVETPICRVEGEDDISASL